MSKAQPQVMSDSDDFQLRKLVSKLNMADWSPTLDKTLQEVVVQSYFNFDLVCGHVNQKARYEAVEANNPIGARDRFTVEHCRLRWSYLHLVRKVDKEPSYNPADWKKSRATPSQSIGKENRDSNSPQQTSGSSAATSAKKAKKMINTGNGKIQESNGYQLDESSTVAIESPTKIKPIQESMEEKTNSFLQKKPLKHFYEIEGQLWKNNISFTPRVKKDILDITNEDFSQYETVDIMGNRATPSTFNIFRDSLRKNKDLIHQRMIENLPDMNHDMDSESSDSENEIVPLDFRTAMINNGTKLVIQARPKEFKTMEQEMQAIEQGRLNEIEPNSLDPDQAIGDLDAYLRSVRKEAFDFDDENVVLIDPGQDAEQRYSDIKLPCDMEQRINNSQDAPTREMAAQTKPKKQSTMHTDISSSKKTGKVYNNSLRQAEKQSSAKQPDYYEKQIAAEREAYIRAQMPKGPVFYEPPKQDSDEEEQKVVDANPNLDFDEILNNMGGGRFGLDSEEETKEPRGARVFRPNLSASQHFMEDSRSAATQAHTEASPEDILLKSKFDAHLADPNVQPVQTESDSGTDTAPCAAIVDEDREETDDEKKERKMLETEESAKLALSGGQKRPQTAKPTSQQSKTAKAPSSGGDQSSEDDQWFAQQRKSARGGARPQTAQINAQANASAVQKRQEREVLMRKLKKQAEEAKARKAQAKKEKAPATNNNTKMINTSGNKPFDFEALD